MGFEQPITLAAGHRPDYGPASLDLEAKVDELLVAVARLETQVGQVLEVATAVTEMAAGLEAASANLPGPIRAMLGL